MQTSRTAPVYKTDKQIVFAESLCVLQMLDGTESLVLYFQNYDMLKSTLKGNVMVNMPLPLKNRSAYKQEVDGGVLL